jgi:nucleotide-binding universal stress UspA family protein
MYKRILIPVDGSEPSNHAVRHGVALAKKFGSEVVILNVIAPFPVVVVDSGHAVELREKLLQERKDMLAAYRERYRTEQVDIQTDIASGVAAEEICRKAEKGDFDLVVIGSRGLSPNERILLGSVSARVCRCCFCPVLLVR